MPLKFGAAAVLGTAATLYIASKLFSYVHRPRKIKAGDSVSATPSLSCMDSAKKHLTITSKQVVIIGASSGLGRAFAHEIAKKGCILTLVARRQDELDKVSQECLALMPSRDTLPPSPVESPVTSMVADITHEVEIKKVADKVKANIGRTNVLILCAGILNADTFQDLVKEDKTMAPSQTLTVIETMFKTNVFGLLLVLKHFLPLLIKSKGGVLVIGSLAGVVGAPTVPFSLF